jgi:probable F420-dependent oxidoreductase
MRFGAIFPTSEIGNDPIVIRDFAQAAEALGYAHIMTYDHVVGATHDGRDPPLNGPYTEHDPFHEPIALFGYLAAATKHILLSTGVLILPQRQTALVAKQMAELDLLSGGRVVLGVGTGWNYVEYGALGVDFDRRGALLDEQIAVLRALWTEPLVDFQGEFHRIDRAGLNPMPRKPIPIWMGGFGKRPVERAARAGDGYIFGGNAEAAVLAEYLISQLRVNGRDSADFTMDWTISFHNGPDAWRAAVEKWRGPGRRYISMRTMGAAGLHNPGPRLETPQQHIDALRTFMNAVRDLGDAV